MVTVSSDGKTIDYKTESSPNIKEIRTLLADNPVPTECGIFYFEVELITALRDGMVGIGFYNGEPSSTANLTKMPGMEAGSWGYHSDDGKVVMFCPQLGMRSNDSPVTMALGPVFGKGDTIGCGLDFIEKRIFYTKNGIYLDLVVEDILLEASSVNSDNVASSALNGRRFRPKINAFYPCVGFKPSVHLQTNFGSTGIQGIFSKQQKLASRQFLFDIDQYVENRRAKVLEAIRSSDVRLPALVTPPNPSTSLPVSMGLDPSQKIQQEDEEKRRLIHKLISSYFAYLGYVDTAKEFDHEGSQLYNQPAEQETFLENAEVVNRQRIGKLITHGQIDEAFASLQEFYPEVLAEPDSLVVFKLECCKFIELIRSTINRSRFTNTNGNTSVSLESDGDVEMRDVLLEEDEDKLDGAIAYGQQLRSKYKNDPRPFVQVRLSLVFSLLAYSDPATQDSSLSFLLDISERVKLSEEVNAKILVSIGKPSIPPLQKLVKQVIAMVWELQDQGTHLDSNLVDVERNFL